MTDKARELLERALEQADYIYFVTCEADTLAEEIRAYLAEPEVKREPLSRDELQEGWQDYRKICSDIYIEQRSFVAGVRFAEKHHQIHGGNNENTNT